jgi:hypothetical protein
LGFIILAKRQDFNRLALQPFGNGISAMLFIAFSLGTPFGTW